ncbi:MAG: RagB/SusD family nutrient uptake outer membrane protein [Bacteroidales bacterium]|nr:RagB/SusD family nutrient uptake outer membrane protein [Bacteroidales bacterium]
MKNTVKYSIICLLGASLLASSCNFLNVDPISEIPESQMWQNQRDVNAGIAEIYSSFRTALRTNWFCWGEMRSDNFVLYQELPSEYSKLLLNQMTTDLPSTSWQSLYKVISNTNFAIQNIPDSEITDQALKNDYLAQAYAMRALCYFYAVRVWGAVPVYLEPVDNIATAKVQGRTAKEDVLRDVIIPDLEMAESLINPANVERKRISRNAIYSILADAQMWLGEWEAADATIDRFMAANGSPSSATTNSTVVFEKDMTKLKNSFVECLNNKAGDNNPNVDEYGDPNEFIFVIHQNINEAGQNNYSLIWSILGCGMGQGSVVVLSPKLQTIYENAAAKAPVDKRFENYLCPSKSSAESYQVHKYMANGARVNYQDYINCQAAYPIYRYTDVLLMQAEVKANLDKWQDALNLVQFVLDRAGVSSKIAALSDFSSRDELIDYILDQKQIEQVGEGKRWFDLVRNHRVVEVMNPINGLSSTDEELFPINQSVLNLCQNAYKQNPGY